MEIIEALIYQAADSAIRNLFQSDKDDYGGVSIRKWAVFPSEPAVKW